MNQPPAVPGTEPPVDPFASATYTPGAPIPVPRAARRPRIGPWINALLGLALAVAIGGVAFAAGRLTAPANAAANVPARGFNGPGAFGGNGFPSVPFDGAGRAGRGLFGAGVASIQGTVTTDSVTITTASGQTITVAIGGTTTYHQQASASASDVRTGGTVIVRLGFRQPTANGTTGGPTATDITIVP
jgi:hypothetical protein